MSQHPCPTERGQPFKNEGFSSLTQALDYAAGGQSGMTFHTPRGDVAEVLSYARLAEDARQVAARFLGAGLNPGDRVGLVAETEANFVRSFMGCLYAGLVPCPMPLPAAFGARHIYGDQIRRIADLTKPRAVIVPGDYYNWVEPGVDKDNLLHIGPLDALAHSNMALPDGTDDPDALAYLQFSSGTTRAPKGIAITNRAMMANVACIAGHFMPVDGGDRGVSWLPFYHDMGLVGCMILPIATQMSIDYLATRDFIRRPNLWPSMISRSRASVSYAPSFGYELAARRARFTEPLDLGHWKVAGLGGDMIKIDNLEKFAQIYAPHGFDRNAFIPSYGMAEATLGLTFADFGRGCRAETLDLEALEYGKAVPATGQSRKTRSFAICGRALPGHRIEIRGPEGHVLGEREIGTVFAAGPSIMQGYYNNPEETAQAIGPDGWLNTGDLGYASNGELILTGRAKDLIIINGRNIWPQDIEWTIEHSLDGVREGGVAAFGSPPDGAQGEETIILTMEIRTSDEKARLEMARAAEELVCEAYGIMPIVVMVQAGTLPRTSSGKLSRRRTRAMYAAGQFTS